MFLYGGRNSTPPSFILISKLLIGLKKLQHDSSDLISEPREKPCDVSHDSFVLWLIKSWSAYVYYAMIQSKYKTKLNSPKIQA